jgi:hypothetical protein
VRQFAHKGFRIEQLSTEAKLLYSAFLVFSLAAMVVSVLYYGSLTDNRPLDGAREYYAGELVPSASGEVESPAPNEEGGGPSFDLPDEMLEDDEPSGALIVQMSYRKLLEVTHFHLFTIPIFLLVITHIFMLCAIRPSIKFAMIASGIVSSAIHMAAPWIIYAGGGGWAWLMPVTGTWMTVTILILTMWPAVAMWRRAKPVAAKA